MKTPKQVILESVADGWEPPYSGSIYNWANKHIVLGPTYAIPGSFDTSRSRYMVSPFEALANHNVRQVNICASVQSGKTLISDIFIPYTIANAAGNILNLYQTDEMASRLAESRLGPILKSTEIIKDLMPRDRNAIRKRSINFPHVNLIIAGAKEAILQSLSIKTLVGDECWLWEPGFLQQAKLRTHAFPANKKILLTSTAGTEHDDWDQEFNKGTIYEWGWHCPSCSYHQPYHFNIQRPNGTWAGLTKSGSLSCYSCSYDVKDTPINRRALNDSGSYIKVKDGDPEANSYHWNVLGSLDIKWINTYREYKQAKNDLNQLGYILPLQEFYQKRLAIPWSENICRVDVKAAIAEYDVNLEWGKYRFLTVDVQTDRFYYGVYAWGDTGEVRKLDHGEVASWGDIRAVQTKWKIKDQHTGIDIGYQQSITAGKAVEFGHEGIINKKKMWLSYIGLKGSKQHYFNHFNRATKQTDKRVYSELGWIDPAEGKGKASKKLPFYNWSNFSVKMIGKKLRDGKIGKFVVNAVDDDYTQQMNSEVLFKETDKKTGVTSWIFKQIREKNHQWDVFLMSIVMAIIAGVFRTEYKPDETELPDDKTKTVDNKQ